MKRQTDHDHLPQRPGVYLLVHRRTRETYIGSGLNIRSRVRRQIYELRAGLSLCGGLRTCADRNGIDFASYVVAETPAGDRRLIELEAVKRLRPSLNRVRNINVRT